MSGMWFGAAALCAPTARADFIVDVLPAFNGEYCDRTCHFPLPPVTVGNFEYAIPDGHQIVSAMIEGTFGNDVHDTTGGLTLTLDGIEVGVCSFAQFPCWTGPGPTRWSHAFTPLELHQLADGRAELAAVQTAPFVMRLGETTLTVQTKLPDPGAAALWTAAALGLGRRRGRLKPRARRL